MSEFLPKEVREGLEAARKAKLKRTNRMRVRVDQRVFQVLRMWDNGFSLDAAEAPKIRGLVDLYAGDRHMYQCLIVASGEDAGEMQYEFKRHTAATDRPPLDFARDEGAPTALIGRSELS